MNRNLIATILIIIAIGLYFTVTEKVIKDARAIKSINDEYVSAIKGASELISLRDKISNDWANVPPADQDRLDKILPRNVDNIRLIIDLNSVAIRHGFSLKNVKAVTSQSKSGQSPIPASSMSDQDDQTTLLRGMANGTNDGSISQPLLDTVTISFGVSAPYHEFIRFMMDLESNLRIMDVNRLSVTSDEDGIYDWSVELRTYWLRSQ